MTNTTHFTRFAKIATADTPAYGNTDFLQNILFKLAKFNAVATAIHHRFDAFIKRKRMHTLNQQEFNFQAFMRRRGWSSVVSIMILLTIVLTTLSLTQL